MICENCGKELKNGDIFCKECGHKIKVEENINKDSTLKKEKYTINDLKRKLVNKKKIVSIGLVICLIICFGAYFFSEKNKVKEYQMNQVIDYGEYLSLTFTKALYSEKQYILYDDISDSLQIDYGDNYLVMIYGEIQNNSDIPLYLESAVKINLLLDEEIHRTPLYIKEMFNNNEEQDIENIDKINPKEKFEFVAYSPVSKNDINNAKNKSIKIEIAQDFKVFEELDYEQRLSVQKDVKYDVCNIKLDDFSYVESNYSEEVSLLDLTTSPGEYYNQKIQVVGYLDVFLEEIAGCKYSLTSEDGNAMVLVKIDKSLKLPDEHVVFKCQGTLKKENGQMIFYINKIIEVTNEVKETILTVDTLQNSIDDGSISQYMGKNVSVEGYFNFDWSGGQGEILYIINENQSLKIPFIINNDFQRMDFMDKKIVLEGEIKLVGEEYVINASSIQLKK